MLSSVVHTNHPGVTEMVVELHKHGYQRCISVLKSAFDVRDSQNVSQYSR